jgi:DNA-binding transcriptional ArsR family regulator
VITIDVAKDLPVLSALADGTRAGIVQMLATRPHSAGEIHAAFPIAAPAVSRHLRVLREAGLVEERRPANDKRVRLYALRPEPLDELATWLGELSRTWQAQLDSFKDFVALRAARPKGAR